MANGSALLYEIYSQSKLATKRYPMYAQNRFARTLVHILITVGVIYLILCGVSSIRFFKELAPFTEPYITLNSYIIYLLIIDFILRCSLQKLPIQDLKSYILLPINRRSIIRCTLALTIIKGINFIGLAFLIPFGYLTIYPTYGIVGLIGFLIGYELLFILNNYWYIICRTLMSINLFYILMPSVIYISLIASTLSPSPYNIVPITQALGTGFIIWHWESFIVIVIAIICLFFICERLQYKVSYHELSGNAQSWLRTPSPTNFPHPIRGEVGEFMYLEIKLLTRNKAPRKRFFTGLGIMLFFSVLLAFTTVYDHIGMKIFICIYNFSILGIMVLSNTMNYEGNYMDGLMCRKESILQLLKAKYYVQCILLLIPFLLMTLPISQGKLNWIDALGSLFLTSGFTFCILMQSAVYNNYSISMNSNLTGRQGTNTFLQVLFTLSALFLPIIIVNIFVTLFHPRTGMLFILITGLLLTLFHSFWLRHIYRRFMSHRYENMEGFRSSATNT